MKLKKILAGSAASVLAVSSLAMSVSAGNGSIYPYPEGTKLDEGCSVNAGAYLVQLFNTGENNEDKPSRDYGIDLNALAGFKVYIEIMGSDLADAADFIPGTDGGFGGAFIYSTNGGDFGTSRLDSDIFDPDTELTYYEKYNWPGDMEWWGVPAEGDSPDNADEKQGTIDYGKYAHMEYIDLTHYKMSCDIPEACLWPSIDERKGTCYQVGLQDWSDPVFHYFKVNMFILLDKDGNPLIAFDDMGNPVQESADIQKMMDDLDTPKEASAPTESTGGDTTNAPTESGDAPSSSDASNSSAPASSAPTTTTSGSTGNNSPDNTGLIIGIIAAVVVVVVVVVVIVIKKKKS